jgi:hypothetical protein
MLKIRCYPILAIDAGLLTILFLTPISSFRSSDLPSPFLDRTHEAGIRFHHQRGASAEKHLVETMGSGCALFDYDQDGWLDVLLINGGITPDSPPVKDKGHSLFRNLGGGRFEDVSARAGITSNGAYGMGVAIGDYNNDGYPDVFVTNFGPNLLFRNNGDGTFTDVTREAGTTGSGWSTSAAFLDFDKDGFLDLFVTRYLDYSYQSKLHCAEKGIHSYCHPRHFSGLTNKLYRNLGDGRFLDVSEASGLAKTVGKGLGVVAADFDGDGWTDLYVANDGVRNFLYKNNGDGTFRDMTFVSGTGYNSEGEAEAGMGVDVGDYNGDGLMDLVVTNYDLETNALYRNEGGWLFSDERWQAGIAQPGLELLGFGVGFLDFDNDGDQDLLVVNGHVLDNIELIRDNLHYAEPMQLFENRGGRFLEHLAFSHYAAKSPRVGRGAGFGDIDNDGDVDVLISNSGEEPTLLVNQTDGKKNWILIKLVGTRSNRDAVGAMVSVTTEQGTRFAQVIGGRSYLSASDLRLPFGLGDSKAIPQLKVKWPSGSVEMFENVRINQVMTITEGTKRIDYGRKL